MGVVYKAEDTRLKRLVALKFLSAERNSGPAWRSRFLREAQSAAALNHPNICTIHEVNEEHGFLCMELLDGVSLKDKIAQRPLPLDAAIDIAVQVARGLDAAHEKGITHRDIKPANIMLTGSGQVKITDFGLAQWEDSAPLTKSGLAAGTPAYMAPEQLTGRPSDRRADLYSFGVVLYEMISGRLPALAEQEPLTALRTGVPRELDRIVARAMAKDPAERYQHAADLCVDLTRLKTAVQPFRLLRRRIAWAAAGAAMAASGAGLYLWRTASKPTQLTGGGIPSKVPAANEAYERAIFLLRPQFELSRGRQLLERAIVLDPKFSEARALYALTHFLMIESGASNDSAWLYKGEQEALQVLSSDPENSRAHSTLAACYSYLGRKELAFSAARRAEKAGGRHVFLPRLYAMEGDYDRAVAILRGQLDKEPLFFPARVTLGNVLRQMGDHEGALRELEKTLDQDPRLPGGLLYSALAHMNAGRLTESRKMLDRLRPEDRPKYDARLVLALQLALEGDRAAALRELDLDVLKYAELVSFTSWAAEVYAVAGEKQKALDWLDRAVRLGDNRAEWFERDSLLANIRNEPGFREIVAAIRRRRPAASF